MTKKFTITLFFIEIESINTKSLSGIRLVGDIHNYQIQILKNNVLKKRIPIPLIMKMDFNTYMFPDTTINYNKNDKIGIKLI